MRSGTKLSRFLRICPLCMIIVLLECLNIFNISSLYSGKYGEEIFSERKEVGMK